MTLPGSKEEVATEFNETGMVMFNKLSILNVMRKTENAPSRSSSSFGSSGGFHFGNRGGGTGIGRGSSGRFPSRGSGFPSRGFRGGSTLGGGGLAAGGSKFGSGGLRPSSRGSTFNQGSSINRGSTFNRGRGKFPSRSNSSSNRASLFGSSKNRLSSSSGSSSSRLSPSASSASSSGSLLSRDRTVSTGRLQAGGWRDRSGSGTGKLGTRNSTDFRASSFSGRTVGKDSSDYRASRGSLLTPESADQGAASDDDLEKRY